jgi:phosphoenolpyruvate carboxylase
MATQHPDNAHAPYWEKDGDGYISVHEELDECVSCFEDLAINEFMWDWEGKYADEAVIDKLFSHHYHTFKKKHIGRDKFLTFRLPNIWQEKGYSLLRALMVILTSEDFARDLKFHSPPLFEVILPMTERADQLLYIQHSFHKLATFKSAHFNATGKKHTDVLEIIPLIEGVESQMDVGTLLREYVSEFKKQFGKRPVYIRPFLARSDPALISGLVATVLANKIALSDIAHFSEETGIPTHPIIGAGSLTFRGGLSPDNIENFLAEYGGIRTVTIQSAFRYDFPLASVKKALVTIEKKLHTRHAYKLTKHERDELVRLAKRAGRLYQDRLGGIVKDMAPFFSAVPKRRERRQHIGLLSYGRKMGKHPLPRAINFTAGFYSVGVPPEFIGLGAFLASLSEKELALVKKYYINLVNDVVTAGKYINRENLHTLATKHPAWKRVADDIETTEHVLGVTLGPRSQKDLLHQNLSSNLMLQRKNPHVVSDLIVETGKIRRSLG